MKRVRFFDGQVLSAQDFRAEQEFHMEKRRLYNWQVLGSGIVNGLAVLVDDGSGSVPVVSPGFTIDRFGREIVVEDQFRIDLAPCPGPSCFVTIEFTETATDPVPAMNGCVEFSRVTEGYAVTIAPEDPSETAKLCLHA